MIKTITAGLLGFLFLSASAGCKSQSHQSASNAFRVALVTPGPVSDAGWNALAFEGLIKIHETLQAETSHIETKTPAEFEEAFRDYASRGFHLVFGHGFEFQDAAAKVSVDFPDTVFITTSGSTVRRNVAPMRFMLEQATYLMGMISATISKTGKAGAVGGIEIPPLKSTFLAFEAGAKSVNPDFQVVVSYIGSWEDVGAAKQATSALMAQGCDIIFPNADAASLGAFQAAQEQKVFALGANKNQNEVAPNVVLASGVIDIPSAFLQIAREVQGKNFHGRIIQLGMKENVISLVYNESLQKHIPQQAAALVTIAQQQIAEGTLSIPSVEFTPVDAP